MYQVGTLFYRMQPTINTSDPLVFEGLHGNAELMPAMPFSNRMQATLNSSEQQEGQRRVWIVVAIGRFGGREGCSRGFRSCGGVCNRESGRRSQKFLQ